MRKISGLVVKLRKGTTIFFLLFLTHLSNAQTDLWWTGATDNTFSLGSNWSTSPLASDVSGVVTALSGPSIGTNVHFVAGSFPIAQAYTITFSSNVTVNDFLVEDLGNATEITFNGGSQLTVVNDLAMVAPAGVLQFNKTGTLLFSSAVTNNTIDFGGNSLNCIVEFNNPNGGWTFTNGLTTTNNFILNDGSLDFNGQTFGARQVTLNGQGASTSVALGTHPGLPTGVAVADVVGMKSSGGWGLSNQGGVITLLDNSGNIHYNGKGSLLGLSDIGFTTGWTQYPALPGGATVVDFDVSISRIGHSIAFVYASDGNYYGLGNGLHGGNGIVIFNSESWVKVTTPMATTSIQIATNGLSNSLNKYNC